jgi:hypothetical protein
MRGPSGAVEALIGADGVLIKRAPRDGITLCHDLRLTVDEARGSALVRADAALVSDDPAATAASTT